MRASTTQLLILLLTCAVIAGCRIPGQESRVAAAAEDYVRANTNLTDFDVRVEGIELERARVRVIPSDAAASDPLIVYVGRQDGQWHGLIYGTAFDPEVYQAYHIPPALWLSQ
jgi:hypothetical protein